MNYRVDILTQYWQFGWDVSEFHGDTFVMASFLDIIWTHFDPLLSYEVLYEVLKYFFGSLIGSHRGKTAKDPVYRATHFSLKAMERRTKIYNLPFYCIYLKTIYLFSGSWKGQVSPFNKILHYMHFRLYKTLLVNFSEI